MPVIHVVLHAYESWNADHPDGWNQHGVPGRLPPARRLAETRHREANWAQAEFPPQFHGDLVLLAREIAATRGWRLHALLINPTHMHLVVSWDGSLEQADSVQATFKRVLAHRLAAVTATPGRRWFSRGGHPTRVQDRAHFNKLLHRYLPAHCGTYWYEGCDCIREMG